VCIELRLHRPGADARLRDAITSVQAADVSDDEIATFRKALAAPRTSAAVVGVGSSK
jgi:hypothetical protein